MASKGFYIALVGFRPNGPAPGSCRGERRIAQGGPALAYSGTVSPEPPNSAGKSLSFGKPSFIRRTVSA